MPPIIQTYDLTRKFKSITAVSSVSFEVRKGEVFGILGPNGAGKTTLLSMLCTILKPTSGTAVINGYDIIRDNAMVRRWIGIVFQDPSVDTDMTSRENLQMHADLYDVPRSEQESRIQEVLELVQLTGRADDMLNTYSGGMRRRLEIARGLLHYPGVLFLDEPTIGLDPQSREHIWNYIRNLKKREDMTIILTTHYMEEADRLCDRVAIIDHGMIVALDQPQVLKQHVGGDRIALGTGDPRTLSEIFTNEGMGSSVQVLDQEIRVTSGDGSLLLPRLIEAAVKAGIHISSVHLHAPDMNDVFMHYTGKNLRQDEGREQSGRIAMMKRRRMR